VTRIQAKDKGPLRVEGEFELVDGQGRAYGLAGRTTISFCRCGGSMNKPFCDGTHNRNGFDSVCEAKELPPPPPPKPAV
jgi:CDGSH-type Zn-finger protein